jgi:glucose-1-phosphatase
MIKLFVFDLGNVILPFENRPVAARLWERSGKRGTLSAEAIFDALFSREDGLINAYEKGRLTSEQFFDQLRRRFSLALEFEEFKGIWNPIFRENVRVREAVIHLKARGYPLFLLSDTNELHFRYIRERYPVVEAFDAWILSYEVGVKKPEKAIYDEIFTRMAVDPGEVFYIDDIERYVEAARGYGIRGTVFRDEASLWRTLEELGV